MARRRKIVGIRRKRSGWQAFIWIDGTIYSKQFPLETPIGEMKTWREGQLAQRGKRTSIPGSFEAAVHAYVKKPEIAARQHLRQLRAMLELWLTALGRDRRLESITRDDVEAVLQGWLASRLSPVTVYHRRTTLSSFFVKMNGEQGYNPVRGTTRPAHWHPWDQSIPFAILTRIIDAMPDVRYVKKGLRRPSGAKLAARLLQHTGMPPAELFKLQRTHFDRANARLRMPWRDKGEGRDPYWLELSPAGLEAAVAIDAADVWGTFPPEETISRSFKRAARRIDGPDTPIHLYRLRHSMGKDLYQRTGDLATVGRVLGHVEGSVVTAQYAIGAHAHVDRAAMAAVHAARQASVAGHSGSDSLPATLPAPVKARKHRRFRRVS